MPTLIVIPGREQLAMAHVFPWYNRWYNQLFVPAFCREATALITHTAASAGVNGADQGAGTAKGILVQIAISAITGTSPTLTVTLQGKAPSGDYHTVLASAALNATGLTVLKVYPGLTAAANTVASDILPSSWRVISTIGGTTPAVTATVHASLID